MSELAKERPPNPVEWLASYLIQHDPQRAGASKGPPPVATIMRNGRARLHNNTVGRGSIQHILHVVRH